MEATMTDAKRRPRTPLIRGREMTCPRCKTPRDILAFQRFEEIEEYEHDTAPIYKCPPAQGGCGWLFAPAEHTVLEAMSPSPDLPEVPEEEPSHPMFKTGGADGES
jgi:hypothetical protein